MRLLLIAALVVGLFLLFKRSRRQQRKEEKQKAIGTIRCDECRLAIPESEALRQGEKSYCSRQCEERARRG